MADTPVKRVVAVVLGAWKRFEEDECASAAASIAFFAGMSLLPALLLLVAIVGVVFEQTEIGRDAEQEVLSAAAAHLSPTLESSVQGVLAQARSGSSVGGPLALLGLLASALIGFAQLDRTFDRMSVKKDPALKGGFRKLVRDFVRHRLMAFFLLCCVALLVLATAIVQTVSEFVLNRIGFTRWHLPLSASSLEMIASWFPAAISAFLAGILVYRVVPRRRPSWQAAALGAAIYAVLWTLGRELAALYLSQRGLSAYGVIGSFLVIQLWIYYAVLVLLFGGEVAFEIKEREAGERAAASSS